MEFTVAVTNEGGGSLLPQTIAQMLLSDSSYEPFLMELIAKMHWGCGLATDRDVELPLVYQKDRWLLEALEEDLGLGRLLIQAGRQHRIQLFVGSRADQVNVFDVVWDHSEIDDMFEKKWEETFISCELWDGLGEAAIAEPHNQIKEV